MKKILFGLLLCSLNVQAQGLNEPGYSSATVAFGSVTSSYTTFLTNGKSWVSLNILNTGDAAIRCTLDGGTTSFLIPALSSFSPELGTVRKYENSNLQCKYNAGALTSGGVDVFAIW